MARLKILGALAVVLALVSAGPATANQTAFPLQFPTSSIATGAMGTVANGLLPQFLGCWSDSSTSTPIVHCDAWQQTPYMALSCVTADATIYNIYRTMRSDSYIEFHVDGSGNCTYLMVKTYSAYEPKR